MRNEIVFVAGKDPLAERGAGHSAYVRAHGRAALRAGFAPHLFCASNRTDCEETAFGTVHRVFSPFRPFRQTMIAGHGRLLARAIERFVRGRGGPALIHGFGLWGRAGVIAASRLQRQGLPATAIVSSYTTYRDESDSKVRGQKRGVSPFHRAAIRLENFWIRFAVDRAERATYLNSRLVLVNYDSVRRLIDGRYGIGSLCERVPYGSEISFAGEPFEPAGETPRKTSPLIVSVARHDVRKGNDVLIEALAILRAAGEVFRARLLGEGPLLRSHRALRDRLGLAAQVEMPGYVPDIRPHLRAADVFVLPSRSEQSGSLALIEALEARVPVVASGVDGILEDVEDGRSAVLVPPCDAAALANGIRRVLREPGLRRRLTTEGRRVFDCRFAPDVFASALSQVYERFGLAPHRAQSCAG